VAATCPVLHRTGTVADVRAVLEGDRFTTVSPQIEGDSALDATALASDGQQHTPVHRIWSTWFSAARVEASRAALIEPVVSRAWRQLRGQGRVDLVASFAGEVVPRVIFGMIGLPEAVGVEAYRTAIVPIARFRADRFAHRREALDAHARLVAELSAHQDVLCPAGRIPGALTGPQFFDVLAVVLELATETTVCAVANMFALIAEYADSWRAVVDGRLTGRCFVDEVLRFEPPSGLTFRFASADARLPSGIDVPRQAAIELNFHRANTTDPHLDAPHQWQPAPGRGTGTSFGFGAHACAGRALALALLVEIVLELARSHFSPHAICEREPIAGRIFRRPSRLVAVL
jgi:cytochrome P450